MGRLLLSESWGLPARTSGAPEASLEDLPDGLLAIRREALQGASDPSTFHAQQVVRMFQSGYSIGDGQGLVDRQESLLKLAGLRDGTFLEKITKLDTFPRRNVGKRQDPSRRPEGQACQQYVRSPQVDHEILGAL